MSSWQVRAFALTAAILTACAWASGWERYTWGARFGTFGCALAVFVVAAVWDVLGLLTPPDQHRITLSAMELPSRALYALLFASKPWPI